MVIFQLRSLTALDRHQFILLSKQKHIYDSRTAMDQLVTSRSLVLLHHHAKKSSDVTENPPDVLHRMKIWLSPF